jgi:hypothetical protein
MNGNATLHVVAQYVKMDFVFDPQPDRNGVELYPSSNVHSRYAWRQLYLYLENGQ